MPEKLTVQELKVAYPDLFKEIAEAAQQQGHADGKAEGMTAGAAAERQRIMDVRSQLIVGHEALIEEMVNDGKTTGPEAAVRILSAEKEARSSNMSKFIEDGKQKVDNASGKDLSATQDGENAATQTEAGDKLDVFAKEIQKTEQLSYADALAKAQAAHPKLNEIYKGGK
jgi:hypothetical protein